MIVKYRRRRNGGRIEFTKLGAFVINLDGGLSMTQEELDFYGNIIARALSNLTPEQLAQVQQFKLRKRKHHA